MVQPPANWLIGKHGRHEQASWNRDLVLEAACEEPQAESKQAQITAVLAVQPLQPAVAHGADAEIDDPEIGQAGGDQQAREPCGIAEMALVELEAATFLVGEKGLNMRAFAVQLQGLIQVSHIRHEIDRCGIGRLPDGQEADRPIGRAGHPRWRHGEGFAVRRFQITDVALKPIRRKTDLRRCPADIPPAQLAQRRLQLGAIKLAITEEDDRGRGRHDRLKLGDQGTMRRLGKVALLAMNHNPDQGQGTALVDDTDHAGKTAVPYHAAVQHELDRLVGQVVQQGFGNGQKPAIQGLGVMFQPAAETGDQAFLRRRITGRMISDRGQVCPLAADQPADHGNQGVQMTFLVPRWAWLIPVHDGAFAGMIAAIRVAHRLLPTERSQARRSIPELARITL